MKFEDKTISFTVLAATLVLTLLVAFAKEPLPSEQKVQPVSEQAKQMVTAKGDVEITQLIDTNPVLEQQAPTQNLGERQAWVTTFGRLNVRSAPDAESDLLGHFVYREELLVDGGLTNGFYTVKGVDSRTGEEITGYCHGDYLSFDPIEDPNVYLDVPAYLQTDSRWADVKIGSTKKTMAAIGCTTTCMAMSKSYLTKTEVHPDDMEELLYYDEDGNLGWPKTYTWSQDSTYYLETIFEKLHEGIPVLIGAERNNGRPHWVLIVGYKGDGMNFSPSDFLILDPLPYRRTNLKQFFDEYPEFYKIAYYTG